MIPTPHEALRKVIGAGLACVAMTVLLLGGPLSAPAAALPEETLLDLQLARDEWVVVEYHLTEPTTSLWFRTERPAEGECPVFLSYQVWTGSHQNPVPITALSHMYNSGSTGYTVRQDGGTVSEFSSYNGCPNAVFFGLLNTPPAEMIQDDTLYVVVLRHGGPPQLNVTVTGTRSEVQPVARRSGRDGLHMVAASAFSGRTGSTYAGAGTDINVYQDPVLLVQRQVGAEVAKDLTYHLDVANPPWVSFFGDSNSCSLAVTDADGRRWSGSDILLLRETAAGSYRFDIDRCVSVDSRITLAVADFSFPDRLDPRDAIAASSG